MPKIMYTTFLFFSDILFFQSHPIGDLEAWVYRISIPICLILIFLLINGRWRTIKKHKNQSTTGKTKEEPRIKSESLQSDLVELRNRVLILEQKFNKTQQGKVENIRGTGRNKNNFKSSITNENPEYKKESIGLQEEIPSPQIDLNIDKNTGNENSENKKEIFYLSSPDKEKIFFAPEATLNPTEKTIYTVEDDILKLHEQIDDQTMRLAFNSLEIFVKRVCDLLNAREPHHSKIVMVEPGKVTKENEDFLVLEKMKVKFE